MSENNIALNFLPLKVEYNNLNIILYRKKYIQQPKIDGIHKKRMKVVLDDLNSNSIDYLISFSEREGFDKVSIKGMDYYEITKLFLYEIIAEKNKTLIENQDYLFEENGSSKIGKRPFKFILEYSELGSEVIEVLPYFLKIEKKIGFQIDYKFVENKKFNNDKEKKQILIKSLALDYEGKANVNYYQDKLLKYSQFINHFIKKKNHFSFPFSKNESIVSDKLQLLKGSQLKNKIYLFKDNSQFNSQFLGISKFGPLKGINMKPLFVVLFKKEFKDLANEFYNALTGIAYPKQFVGFQKFFKTSEISKDDFKGIIMNSYGVEELADIKLQIENIKINFQDRAIIGIFIEHNKEHYITEAHTSPYYALKDLFVNVQIPLQVLTIERISAYQGLKWSISNIALGIFSKLGGYPWKIQPTTDDCVIFGVNKCHKKNFENHKIEKYFAYSVCLNSNGLYEKLDILGDNDNEDNYLSELQINIVRVISDTLKHREVKRCVLHLPFKIQHNEIQRIKKAIETLSVNNEKIDFQVIKINIENSFFGFSTNPSRVPFESTTIQLSNKEFLVWFEGLQYGANSIPKKYGNPVHIEFLTDCNIDNMYIYLQDTINLSGANWRGFNAKLSPISLFYPKLISNYIMEIRPFDADFENKIQNIHTPWFL